MGADGRMIIGELDSAARPYVARDADFAQAIE